MGASRRPSTSMQFGQSEPGPKLANSVPHCSHWMAGAFTRTVVSSVGADHIDQVPEFGLDLSIIGNSVADRFPQQFAEPVAQAMHRYTHCIRRHPELEGKLSLRNRSVITPH